MFVGERLLLARRRKGLTQKQLAAELHIQPSDIYRLERGVVKDPRFSRVVALAKVLGVSTDFLAGLVPIEDPQAEPQAAEAA